MRRFLALALSLSLAVWISATAVGASLTAPNQSASGVYSTIEQQPTTSYVCYWIYWNGMWWCIP